SRRTAQVAVIRRRAVAPYTRSIRHETNLVRASTVVEARHFHGAVIERKLGCQRDIAEWVPVCRTSIGELEDAVNGNRPRIAGLTLRWSFHRQGRCACSSSEPQDFTAGYRHNQIHFARSRVPLPYEAAHALNVAWFTTARGPKINLQPNWPLKSPGERSEIEPLTLGALRSAVVAQRSFGRSGNARR